MEKSQVIETLHKCLTENGLTPIKGENATTSRLYITRATSASGKVYSISICLLTQKVVIRKSYLDEVGDVLAEEHDARRFDLFFEAIMGESCTNFQLNGNYLEVIYD